MTVAEGNTELPKHSLIVQGYDVVGQVKSEGESVKNTIVVLLSEVNLSLINYIVIYAFIYYRKLDLL